MILAKAVEIAFREDKEIMVEDYLTWYRISFLCAGDQTLAVLLRVPVNVIEMVYIPLLELVA